MFERFTERARQVVVLAQDEARTLRHDYIGTEHLLLGLLREQEGPAAGVLEARGVTLERAREQVERIVGVGDEVKSGQIPFTPRAKRTLERALREALTLGHRHIGTEHLLLGLAREPQGVAVQIVFALGATPRELAADLTPQLHREPPPGYVEGFAIEPVATSEERPERFRRGALRPWQRVGAVPMLVGWLLFAVSLGLGILIGRLVWG